MVQPNTQWPNDPVAIMIKHFMYSALGRPTKLYKLWWKYRPSVTIVVPWPRGVFFTSSGSGESADPNDHYRPELEQLVGKQGWSWDWGISSMADNTVFIKIKKSKKDVAAFLALKWG